MEPLISKLHDLPVADSLSPIDNQYHIITRERWQGILQCKQKFLQDDNYNPCECSHMDPDIAASWTESRRMGVNPNQPFLGGRLQREDFLKVLDENKLLIDIARPLFNTFKNLAINTGYGLYIADRNCIFLLHEGKMLDLPIDSYPLDGMLWNERKVGTTAHALCSIHKRPFQVVGAENYCRALENIIASAAPIRDINGDVIATLVLAQTLIDEPWKEEFQNLYSNTLGLITSIAQSIELQLQLKKSFIDLKMANHTLSGTLELINEGIATIDKKGTIKYCNSEAQRLFGLMPFQTGQRNIKELLGPESAVLSLANKGNAATVEETLYLEKRDEQYIIEIQPIMDEDSGELDVAILTIHPASKINRITANRAGSLAGFTYGNIIGESDAIKEAITKAQRYGASRENILLIGESGTGKELFAQSIHNQYCPHGPFIAINCAALPRELIESELFGYEGGSFTGADRSGRPGKIELADGGTLVLDEIGDMPIELQAVLLRVLEDKQVMRIGGRQYKKVNFRVIAATNQNLNQMVEEKLFRGDLFYRLSVLTITIPPLRERNYDAEVLANYFVNKYCQRTGKTAPHLSLAVRDLINEYYWPGNVRELENAMISAVINAQSQVIEPENMPDSILSRGRIIQSAITATKPGKNKDNILPLNEIEKAAISEALENANGNAVLAACLLGISKSTIYRKIKEYDITC